MHKRLSILGSTGSIGTQALDVARLNGFTVCALTANRRIDVLEKQIREFHPALAAVVDERAAKELHTRVADTSTKVLGGMDGVIECARAQDADTVLNAIVGMAGLTPTLAAIDAGKEIALANKETLVAGGKLVMEAARKKGVRILPVDSEHSAIFQCLQGAPAGQREALKRIILTASGGPFFGRTKEELRDVTVAQALKHPNWSMGAKITIDSATMMNKGLELIEAVWLFSMPPERVDIVVHRESVVHSLIEYADNSVIAQLGVPDMRIPIQYALTYPKRYVSPVEQLSLAKFGTLHFAEPDYESFPLINVCRQAISRGGIFPAAANAANEEANRLFREGKIRFLEIGELVAAATEQAPDCPNYTLDDIREAGANARDFVRKHVKG